MIFLHSKNIYISLDFYTLYTIKIFWYKGTLHYFCDKNYYQDINLVHDIKNILNVFSSYFKKSKNYAINIFRIGIKSINV